MPNVLVVDDQENHRKTLAIGLRSHGFDVALAATSVEAMSALGRGRTDIAIIDLMMPGLNGLELARQIRTAFPSVRVVLSSAYHLSARQVARADCGAVGFVPKPYHLTELCEFLQSKTRSAPALQESPTPSGAR